MKLLQFCKTLIFILLISILFMPGFLCAQELQLPYEKAGLTKEQAAAFLLNRFAYGPTPGQVDEVVDMGLEKWTWKQLHAAFDDHEIEKKIHDKYDILDMSIEEISLTYPSPPIRAIAMLMYAHKNGRDMDLDSLKKRAASMNQDTTGSYSVSNIKDRLLNLEEPDSWRYDIAQYVIGQKTGFEPFMEYVYQLMGQKLERAVYNPNQLKEVMTDFWFNHFNVSLTKFKNASYLLSYERDAIRPHALGQFQDLLGATAYHPAMLVYLDNNRSNSEEQRATLRPPRRRDMEKTFASQLPPGLQSQFKQVAQKPGINENYARELMELHTLGVDGGYTQQDIIEIARAFTGWKASPFLIPFVNSAIEPYKQKYLARQPHVELHDGFFFDPTRHDAEAKTILGNAFPAGGGIEEGEKVLDILAAHPSTAQFISQKLAVRFVSDNPPAALTEQMADAFQQTDGNIKEVLKRMVESEYFWKQAKSPQKIKTPFEYIVSAIRATGTEVENPRDLLRWSTKMGMPLYAYEAPTGYPEQTSHWTNGAAMLTRIQFAKALTRDELNGVESNFEKITEGNEAATIEEAISNYLSVLLPGRDHHELTSMLVDSLEPSSLSTSNSSLLSSFISIFTFEDPDLVDAEKITALIIGSPEFQKQ